MTELIIRMESWNDFADRTRAAAKRLDGGDWTPAPAEYSFATIEQFFRVLTPNRWGLLQELHGAGSTSVRALSKALGRDYRGVHSDVMALIEAGLIERGEDLKISAPWSKITAELTFQSAAA